MTTTREVVSQLAPLVHDLDVALTKAEVAAKVDPHLEEAAKRIGGKKTTPTT